MGEIIEKRRRYYSGLDADKDTIPAGNKAVGDSYFSTDKTKQYYWNGAAWKTGLGYEYVPRDVAAVDFNVGNFTVDGNDHADGLDLTGIVPAGAVAAHILLTISATAASKIGLVKGNATTKDQNRIQIYTQVANISVSSDAILNIDSNRLVDYLFQVNINAIELTVMGWFI